MKTYMEWSLKPRHLTSVLDDVNDQIHVPAVLPLGKAPQIRWI